MVDPENKYTVMQRCYYNNEAAKWNLVEKSAVIGNFAAHTRYDDLPDLFGDVDRIKDWKILDFGCGPGRNLIRLHNKVARIDGVDISHVCLDKAKEFLTAESVDPSNHTFYLSNGVDLQEIPDDKYDAVMSVITLQHICVRDIRWSLMWSIHRVLKPGGLFTAQMGYGNRQGARGYYENYYEATETNGWYDVMVDDPEQLQTDLELIGFKHFKYHLTPIRGGDAHEQWIYFQGIK